MHDILVLGGSGFIGSRFCALLAAASPADTAGRIAVATRRREQARHLRHLPGVVVEEADVHDDAALARLLAGRSAVVNLIAILHGDAAAFARVHAELPQRIAGA